MRQDKSDLKRQGHGISLDRRLPTIVISKRSLFLKYLICIDAIALDYRVKLYSAAKTMDGLPDRSSIAIMGQVWVWHKADIAERSIHVRFTTKADIARASQQSRIRVAVSDFHRVT